MVAGEQMPHTTRAVVVEKPGADFTIIERPVTDPPEGAVRLKVAACGICQGDTLVKEGHWPGLSYPRIPGHEVAGVIDALGTGVVGWAVGDRVGIGWHGDHCGRCEACRCGEFVHCVTLQITGLSFDGGYQQYMIAPVHGLARIPDAISLSEAGPLLCAGVTTFNSLRHSNAKPGHLVAVHGIGGLGHLAVQFARAFGFRVVAISRGKDKAELAERLGAHQYLDTETVNAAEELQRMGGARVILATAPSGRAISALVDGLGLDGTMIAVAGTMEPVNVSPIQLIARRRRLQGWASGSSKDSEDTLDFCALTGIRPMIEEFALEEAAKGFDRMLSSQVRFRAVLVSR
jgi:D-arabinose 1-dehydrogenase-like Zn-dependent alcohol dehydrogenase